MLILLSILSAGNTISMNIFSMKKERMLLTDLGMTKRKIRLLLWMRFGKIGLLEDASVYCLCGGIPELQHMQTT